MQQMLGLHFLLVSRARCRVMSRSSWNSSEGIYAKGIWLILCNCASS
jgi:hypothetical protein